MLREENPSKEINTISNNNPTLIRKKSFSIDQKHLFNKLKELSNTFLEKIEFYGKYTKYGFIKETLHKYKKTFLDMNNDLNAYVNLEKFESIPNSHLSITQYKDVFEMLTMRQNPENSVFSLLAYKQELIEELLVKLVKTEEEDKGDLEVFNALKDYYAKLFGKIDKKLERVFDI